mgnify:CR=1 FL=1
MSKKSLNKTRTQRKERIRAKIFGTAEKPRLSIFRSNRYTYFQLIDDDSKKTLVGGSTRKLMVDKKEKTTKQKTAEQLGELIAQKAIERGVKRAVFDRGRYKYHGRVKAIADGARKGGLKL